MCSMSIVKIDKVEVEFAYKLENAYLKLAIRSQTRRVLTWEI